MVILLIGNPLVVYHMSLFRVLHEAVFVIYPLERHGIPGSLLNLNVNDVAFIKHP
jgi:hypothetical protein